MKLSFLKILPFITVGLLNTIVHTKVAEFIGSPYAQQAPQELIELTETVAHSWDFEKPYEVIIPTKAGIQVNPWNLFTYIDVDPLTKNPYILINQEWFLQLPQDQQTFLLERNFARIIHGALPQSFKYVPYIFALISLIIIVILSFIFRATVLKNQTIVIAVFAAIGITLVLELTVLEKMRTKVNHMLGVRYDKYIHELVIAKTNNRQAAIDAFEAIDEKISEEIANGQSFFVPYASIFKAYAEQLK